MVDTDTEHVDGGYRQGLSGDHVHCVADDNCHSFWVGPWARRRPGSYSNWDKAHYGHGT